MSPDVLLGWLPTPFLALMLYVFIKREIGRLEQDKRETKEELKKIGATLIDMDKRSVSTASVEQLGRMGDRFDGRIVDIATKVAVLESVVRSISERAK